jgi:hypothetical protein
MNRSFVPPVRDEESETQRKAHAKRVRETRRSTQGVTLEEVKTAEQLAKKKQAETVSLDLILLITFFFFFFTTNMTGLHIPTTFWQTNLATNQTNCFLYGW